MLDTKSKSSKKWLGNLICIMLIIFMSMVTIICYPMIRENAENRIQNYSESFDNETRDQELLANFVNMAYVGCYGFYWDIQQKVQNRGLDPFELFYPDYAKRSYQEEDQSEIEWFNEALENWNSQYQTAILGGYGVKYQVMEDTTKEFMNNTAEDLSKAKKEDAAFYMKCSFDKDGNFLVEELISKTGLSVENLANLNFNKSFMLNQIGCNDVPVLSMEQPRNMTVYLVSDNEDCFYMGIHQEIDYDDYGLWVNTIRENTGYQELLMITFGILALAALLLPLCGRLEVGTGFFGKLPLELDGVMVFVTAFAWSVMGEAIYNFFYAENNYLMSNISWWFPWLVHAGMWVLLYSIWFAAILSIRAIFTLGPVRYIKERILCIVFCRWIWKNCSGAVKWVWKKIKDFFRLCVVTLDDVDLTDPSDKVIFKVLGLNFIIVFLCCFLWYFGVAALILYTGILFFILKKYVRNIKEKYNILLCSTRRMAKGDLQAEIVEDLGIFEPLKKELNKVQIGFRKAVEEEIKSQDMKTELITNVSHDLKTPLTAIITYVNLLKDENITPEERKNYISILDRKSLRLKQLIEDLFEISKAASGNIKVEKKMLNLTELVKQAAFELEDRLNEAEVQCRVSVPEKDIVMELDGEKTYRCLENLLTNVSKYGMKGTRAYLNMYDSSDHVEIVLKNISAQELTMNVEDLTERFIRGDKSRNTEGSGLGLAIVKSFMELQGGSFHVEADGDLFKARMIFPKGVYRRESDEGKDTSGEI